MKNYLLYRTALIILFTAVLIYDLMTKGFILTLSAAILCTVLLMAMDKKMKSLNKAAKHS
ncbi:hypothetical protein L1279_001758 [Planomicrobium sp. HSC-17F08]|jgi:hypothetical protein|nr:hypothetical protein G159_14320 [Planococcus glaciei CHR43]MCP2034771.1 hypothetical protein [Planomicrobium sp. HSC-17F08]SDI06138.1 hypothetical protein SAMN04487975_11198 [Planococcus glaciei]